MAVTATASDAKFILNTGDKYYWCGIQNTSDFKIQKDFLEPYNYSSLQFKWYSTLGVMTMYVCMYVCMYVFFACPNYIHT